uniref:Uncharacterized protein n=1 Tax=Amphimedon queenslandica TaxID=400682 RepID=A0A1X7VVG6_AMPQE
MTFCASVNGRLVSLALISAAASSNCFSVLLNIRLCPDSLQAFDSNPSSLGLMST